MLGWVRAMKPSYNELARAVPCPYCHALKGELCWGGRDMLARIAGTHTTRRAAAKEARRLVRDLAVQSRWQKRRVSAYRKRRVTTPRRALQTVYDMACEMSRSSEYAEMDDDGMYVGVDPATLKALEDVRLFFRLKGDP